MLCEEYKDLNRKMTNEVGLINDFSYNIIEPRHDETNRMSAGPVKTQISLCICPVWSVFTVRLKKPWVLSYPLSAQRRHWSDWADAQVDLSLRWAHSHFVGFVMRQLIFWCREGILGVSLISTHKICFFIWATTWQNQQNERAPSEDSDQTVAAHLHFYCNRLRWN